MGMEKAERMLLCGEVVPQHKVQLIKVSPPSGDRSDRIVRNSVCFREDHNGFIAVLSPAVQDALRQFCESCPVRPGDPYYRHRPLNYACPDVLIAFEGELRFHFCLLHGKGISSALEVIVGKDRSADDGEVGVGANKIVRKLGDKVEQLVEACAIHLHGYMLPVQADAVLIVVHIRGILQIPGRPVDRNGDHPVVLSRRMVDPSRVSLVFCTKLALGVRGNNSIPRCSDRLGILLRF